MKPPLFALKPIGSILTLLTVAMLAGCPTVQPKKGGPSGPPVGVIEMDQNTDPRFFVRYAQGTIGRVKTAGKNVQINGKRMVRDTRIQNGAHVRTGPASAAIIEFFPSTGADCGLEARDFRHGRIYGLAERCSHVVVTDQGAMEISGNMASYHVENQGAGLTVFTAIDGQAKVWRHADPSYVVPVPSYHRVGLSQDRISPPQRVTREEVQAMISWRQNFQRYKEESRRAQDDPSSAVIFDPDTQKRVLEELLRIFDRSKPRGRIEPKDTPTQPSPDPHSDSSILK